MPSDLDSVTAAIPVKPFDAAKRRLSAVLDAEQRRTLGERLARRTVDTVRTAGVRPLVLSADDGVTRWARETGVDVLLDEGSSLDRAATTACSHILADGSGWMVIHADLPLLSAIEIAEAAQLVAAGRTIIAPSSDGGTSAVGSRDPIGFSYGSGSFHRHLRALATTDPVVLARLGWALDLDTPADLEAASKHPAGAWLNPLRLSGGTPPSGHG